MNVRRVVTEQRCENHQEDQRQRDREEAALRIAQDQQQVVAQLVRDEPRVAPRPGLNARAGHFGGSVNSR